MAGNSHYVPTYHSTQVDFKGESSSGTASVYHIQAGSSHHPTVLLLHGFPASSHQYVDIIPMLADKYHVLAPDLPGFGLTTVPSDFKYTFANLTSVIAAWVSKHALKDIAVYIFDYGAPVGLRLALQHPNLIKAVITQNGNAYEEGFGKDFWAPINKLWETKNDAGTREFVEVNALTKAFCDFQYTAGVPEKDLHLIDMYKPYMDFAMNVEGHERAGRQLDLFYDYRTNIDQYPAFQKWFRESKVPILAVWGKGDPAFIPPGAEAYKRDSPNAKIHFVDSGHFALETKRHEIVKLIREFLEEIKF